MDVNFWKMIDKIIQGIESEENAMTSDLKETLKELK